MALVDRINAGLAELRHRDTALSINDWAEYFTFGGNTYGVVQTTMGQVDQEQIGHTSVAGFKGSGPIFSLVLARLQVFSQVRFQWTRFKGSQPTDLFGSPELGVLERPWRGGTTSDLLARMEVYASVAGCAYVTRPRRDQLSLLRPDRVIIVMGSQTDADDPSEAPDAEIIGFIHSTSRGRMTMFSPNEVAYYAPIPDPDYRFLGMSWITPVIRDLQADSLATEHKARFFVNSATPNLAIRFDASITIEKVKQFKALLEAEHKGAFNAWKCVTPETELALWDGRRVRADQVRPGDELASWAGGQAVPGMVTHIGWQPPSPIVTVTTQRGRVLRTTAEHPYLARRVVKRHDRGTTVLSVEDWTNASDLRPGDLVRIGLGWGRDTGKRDLLTIQQAWCLGALTGDGGLTTTTPVLSAADPGIADRLAASYGLNRIDTARHDYRVLGIRALCAEHDMMGKRAWEKRVPVAVMTGSGKVQAAFLSGLIDTDGHVSDPAKRRSAEVGITSTSLDLLSDVQHLLAGLGVNASISSPTAWKPDGKLRRRQAHQLAVHGNNQATLLGEILDLACEAKAHRLAEYATRTSRQRRSLYDRVESVEIGPSEPTIAVEVAEWHTHITAGIVTHNTLYLGGGADPVPVGNSFKDMDYAVIQGRAEPLALDTPVATTSGWVTMANIKVGDDVFGRDGRPVRVAAVGPVWLNRDCFRISLKNGEQIVADASHVWPAVDRGTASRAERDYTTAELYEIFTRPYTNYEIFTRPYTNGVGGHRLSLGASPVLEMPDADLLVDPYVLGAWLGDGYTAGAAICGDWEDLKHIAAEIDVRGYVTRRWESQVSVARAHQVEHAAVVGVPGGLLAALSALGVLGNKRIPGEYLRASAAQRLDLLRGLMDTDGTADRDGQGWCAYSSKDEALARQVLELVRSLGYRATLSSYADSRSRTGQHWKVEFRSRLDCIPFLLPRKVAKCEAAGDPHFSGRRSIVNIEPVDSVPVRCITVDSADHVFLAGAGFIPTHNSRLASAAGVPPSWVGFAEGLSGSSLNAGNFKAAHRRYGDGTMTHLWTSAATSLEVLLDRPASRPGEPPASLWYDSRIPFMREDAGDLARIQADQAQTIVALVRDGFTPESSVAAVINNDFSLLVHSGKVSVQLQEPGAVPPSEGVPAGV
ncbi:MAG TPA: LAGLIDADG family homing endonuclease [Candidatus Limnocylindrales bacterium]|nr:LAGLIDADG family homing endonuclease [Candidatus Limnocylindrales bacterium]